MSMFSQDSARLIGLDVFKARFPHLTGKGQRILQVEWEQDGTFHKDEVLKVMTEIAPEATFLFSWERPFYNALCNYFGMGPIGVWRYGEPPVADWGIECHAYTATRGGNSDVRAAQAQDRRIARDGVKAFAASGNAQTDVKGQWHRSRLTGMCGTPSSPAGIFNMGTLYGTQPYPDLTVPTQHTSIATPVAAACAALLGQAGFKVDAFEFSRDAGGNLRIDLTAERLLGVVPALETFTARSSTISVKHEPFAPESVDVEQYRPIYTTTEYWDEGSFGTILNKRQESTISFEHRKITVNVPTL